MDAEGAVWLIECNCPPCVETATGIEAAENLHDAVADGIVQLVVQPTIRGEPVQTGCVHDSTTPELVDNGTGFICCKGKREDFVPSPPVKLAFNSFAWSKFVRSQRSTD